MTVQSNQGKERMQEKDDEEGAREGVQAKKR